LAELEKEVRERYVPNLFRNLTVTFRVQDRFFYVDGQVRNPNRFDHRGDITMLGAIAAAGGPTDFAKLSKVKIIRVNGKIETVNYKKAQTDSKFDAPIYPGDRIIVPKRIF
jgi:polysaccharide export outer membrane protein